MIPLMAYIRSVLRDEERRDWLCKGVWVLLLLILLVWGWYYNNRTYSGCKTWFEDDPMILSGFVTVFIGLLYSLLIDRNQIKLVRRLHDIAVINLDSGHWSEIRTLLKRYARISYIFTTFAVIVLMIFGFYTRIVAILCDDSSRPQTWTGEFVIVVLFCTVLVCLRLGRAVANGFTGRAIKKVSPSFAMVPQHPDDAGGLDSIGRFYLWQAGGLLIPTIWLLMWIWFMPARYEEDWLLHFQRLLLFLTVVIWPTAVVSPMYSFHRLIVTWKVKHLEPTIVHIRTDFRKLRGNHLQSRYQHHRTQELFNYLYSLTTLPDWPLSSRTLTVFRTVAVPFLAAVLGSLLSSILNIR